MARTGIHTRHGTINRYWLLSLCTLCLLVLLFTHPIPQDTAYHSFADNRTILGIDNFWNVLTNLAFVLSGLPGIVLFLHNRNLVLIEEIRLAYPTFFLGVLLTGLGSTYYHLAPDNVTLVWDRLPMTLSFMSFFCIVLAEYIDAMLGRKLLWPLLLAGVLSVVYWFYSETRQQGDLRAYILVQFLPMLLTPLILLLYTSRFTHTWYFWCMLGLYLAAKLTEHYDAGIYELCGFSGHSMKHLLVGLGGLMFYLMLVKRQPAAP